MGEAMQYSVGAKARALEPSSTANPDPTPDPAVTRKLWRPRRLVPLRRLPALAFALLLVCLVPGAGQAAMERHAGPDANFPKRYSKYHNYPEMVAHIHAVAAAHPGIVRVFSIGKSYQGRDLWAAEVTSDVGGTERKPEVLFDGVHHAIEALGGEMMIGILDLLADNYGKTTSLGQRVTRVVDTRRVWIVFMVNPDGLQYTVSGGHLHYWRKNRQPNGHLTGIGVGTDLNRNYGYKWGCCGGSGASPTDDDYRGSAPFSAPETRAIRDFIESRIIDGRQQIRVSATFHTPGHLMIWPYGWTSDNSKPEMTRADHRVFVALGTAAAKRNDYEPLQWGTGRRTSGSAIDWQYGDQRIFSFLIEMGDKLVNPEKEIAPEVHRNYDALLYLMEQADCPYRAIGKAQEFCGPFFDDFEASRGWVRNPDHSDTATDGGWSVGIAKADANQPAGAPSGEGELATGLRAGHDVDGGTTTIRSTLVSLPSGPASLHFRYRARLSAGAAASDGLTVQLIKPNGQVAWNAFGVHGNGSSRSIGWTEVDLPIPASVRDQSVAIQFAATDRGADSTVEAGVDDVRITTP